MQDGLREKADFYQAKISLLASAEKIQAVHLNLLEAQRDISKILERQFLQSEVSLFPISEDGFLSEVPTGKLENNKRLKEIQIMESILRIRSKQTENMVFPNISLSASYSTNDYDSQIMNSVSRGHLGNDNEKMLLQLNFKMPLGFRAEKAKRAKAKSRLNSKRLEKDYYMKSMEKEEKSAFAQVKKLDMNIKSVRKRRELSLLLLKENNILYSKGRADIDRVLRAEEELIGTEKKIGQLYGPARTSDFYSCTALRKAW